MCGNTNLDTTEISRICICGAGHQGISMAAHLALNGVKVRLWNRTEDNISKIKKTKQINCNGIISGTANLEMVSSDMAEAISDYVMVTTPSNAHRDIAKTLAPYVHENMVIILNPGRTFGAIEFAKTLIECGIDNLPHIAETQTIIYTCRKLNEDSATIFALKRNVKIAAIRQNSLAYILAKMPSCIKLYFNPASSILETSLSNVGMVLHCSPVMMNIGWIETEKVDFKYYYDGISYSVAGFLEKIDAERLAVAEAAGCPVESVVDWLKRSYYVQGNSLFECIRNNKSYKEIDAPPTIYCRYLMEDVPNGLVPVECLGAELGVKTPNITTIIDLANSVLNMDFRKNGRTFHLEKLKDFL